MPTKISGNGGYSWWARPIAVLGSTNFYFGAIANNDKRRVFQNSSSTYADLETMASHDDHNAPSVLVRSGKDKLVFGTSHGATQDVKIWRATGGLSTFTSDGSFSHPDYNITYVQACDYADKIAVFSRSEDYDWRFRRTTNWGSSWGDSRRLLHFVNYTGQKYMITSETSPGSGIYHIAAYGHPTGSDWRGMVYGRLNMNSGNVANASGTIANLDGTNLPLTESSLDDIVPTTGTEVARLFDVGTLHGNPAILYAKWDDTNSVPAGYWLAYRDSSLVWHHVDLNILAGAYFWSPSKYLSGMSVSKNDVNQIATAREDNGTWYIETHDINSSYAITSTTVIDSSDSMLVRPTYVERTNKLIYQKIIHYNDYSDYSLEYWKEDL